MENSTVKKQYSRDWMNGFKTVYSKFGENILTVDGLLISQTNFNEMSYKEYMTLLKTRGVKRYDYKKMISMGNSEIYDNEKPKVKEEKKIEVKKKKNKTNKKLKSEKNNAFSILTKIIMLVLTLGTATLSIRFTGERMSDVADSIWIGYLISIIMYLYALFGSNFALELKEKGAKFASFIIFVTSILTIVFSMCTSLLENGERYYKNNYSVEEKSIKEFESNKLKLQNIEERISDTKEMIEWYKSDTDAYNANHTSWESSGASKTTKENLNSLTETLNKLYEEKQLILEETPISENEEYENNSTFIQLISNKFGFDGNMLYMFLLLFSSVFIDLIGPMCLYMVRFKEK